MMGDLRRPSTSFSTQASVSTPHLSVGYRNRSSNSQISAYRSVASTPRPSRQTRAHSTISGHRSRANSSIWGSDGQQVLCAVSEARGVSPAVGLAFINTTTNEAVLSQICDSQFYVKAVHKIRLYEPSTILIINTGFPPNPTSSLLSVLQEELPTMNIEPWDRKYWSEIAGLELIQALAFRQDLDTIMVAIQGNFYATCSFAAALKYMEHACHLSIMSHSLRIQYQPSENSMMIDISTLQSLELIQNLHVAKSKDCLFGLLNETLTPMGSRMLRNNILQPSTQAECTLVPRFDALDELTAKENMFFEVRNALMAFSDVEKLLTQDASIYASEQAINNVLMIKGFLVAIEPLHSSLSTARSDLLCKIRDICRPELIQKAVDLITTTINEDVVPMEAPVDRWHQRTYAVKSGVHGMLDVARRTYKEGTDDVHQHVETIQNEHELPYHLKFDHDRKYWLRLRDCDVEGRNLPDILINRVHKKGFVECQTMALVKLNNRITDSHNEAVMLSDGVIQDLLDAIRGHIPNLFRVCESISMLDMLASFGQLATTRDYVRPELGQTLALKAARHPIREAVMQQRFVPNDVFSSEQNRFQIITGCNMSGKSTYIRMVSLLQIMAQIGCFVPAEYAAFPIIHQLLVRMSTDDSIEANMSTFSVEMREMAFILSQANGKCLVIVDELGRGTSTRDGLAIGLAISEALIQSHAFVWFATHFSQLAKILGSRPGVLNLHLAIEASGVDDEIPKMTMLYKVNSGAAEDVSYGLKLARVVGFPPEFMQLAEHVSESLQKQIEEKKQSSQSRKVALKRKLILNLYETLQQMRDSAMEDNALGSYMKRLQSEFVVRMDEIEQGGQAESETGESTSVVESEQSGSEI